MSAPSAPSRAMTPCFYGSVNRWECDENDHLNVRFFAHKSNQAVQAHLAALGFVDAVQSGPFASRVASQHIRFLREARLAVPLRIDCGTAALAAGHVDVLSLTRNNLTDELLCAFVTRVDVRGWPHPRVAPALCDLPGQAQPRGIDPADAYPTPPGIEAAAARGFQTMGRGVIGHDECAPDGTLLPHVYIGRVSDGMPNLWAFVSSPEHSAARDSGELGGAALEYRLTVHAPLHANHVYRHMSGIRALGNKTQHMVHQVYDETTGVCAASAEAVGVAMDLTTRRAVPISAERRRMMERLLLS
ncbi:MAG: hypothetical protein R3E86_04575 [Pseudomonadales bacterium]